MTSLTADTFVPGRLLSPESRARLLAAIEAIPDGTAAELAQYVALSANLTPYGFVEELVTAVLTRQEQRLAAAEQQVSDLMAAGRAANALLGQVVQAFYADDCPGTALGPVITKIEQSWIDQADREEASNG
jgi:hypothetical protein